VPRRSGRIAKTLAVLLLTSDLCPLISDLCPLTSVSHAAINVTVTGPGGSGQAVLPDEGGSFEVEIPLNRNAVNPLTVMATDTHGQTRSAELAITQLSLDQIVVSRVTTERLSTEEVERLVADGVIDLVDPENYNVSEFAIVLTIDGQEVPISVPIAFPIGVPDPVGYENIRLPWGDGGSGGRPPPPPPPEIIVFVQEFTASIPGEPTPPPIPGVIIIEGRIKSLKEFFTVRLLLMNTSGIFTLADVMADLEFPDGGLSHVLPADGIASFGDILPGTPDQPGALEKEFIIRGDEIGVKGVRVNFGGTVAGPGIPADDAIPFNGSAEATVEVKGPPAFQVMVKHPDLVVAGVPYDLVVEVLNAGELPALYASLELDVSADAQLADCALNEATGEVDCEYVSEPVVQSLGHIDPAERVSVTYTVLPSESGRISSCVGVSDQNITLQVVVGDLGCVVGHYPPDVGAPEGIPTVTVVPVNNAQGVSIDSPVVAFFSELMSDSTIRTGTSGTFNVVDAAQNIVPGRIRIETNLSARTMAIFQVDDGALNRWRQGEEYTVYLSQGVRDRDGHALFNEWISTFKTTTMGVNDLDPPLLTLSIEPPVNPNYVIPGEVVRVNAYATDQGSGVARVELRMKDLDGTDVLYTLVDQKSVFAGDKPPFIFALDSANLVFGHTYQLLATAYDGMGNAQNATLAMLVAPTADPPVIVLPDDPLNLVLQGISVTLKPAALTGGVHEVRYYLDGDAAPYKTVTLPPWQASLSTLALGLSNHVIRAEAEDGLGQIGQDTYSFNLVSNPSLPVVSFPGSVDGEAHVSGPSFSIDPDVTDEVGLKSVHVFLVGSPAELISSNAEPVVIHTTNRTSGTYKLLVVATNNLGHSNDAEHPDSSLEFVIVPPPVGMPPDAPTVDTVGIPSGGFTSVSGTSSNNARIDIENVDLGVTASVFANGSGAFTAGIAAEGGDTLRLVSYDFAHSLDPSPPTDVVVPDPPVLVSITLEPESFTLGAVGAYRQLTVWGAYDNGQTNEITTLATFVSSSQEVASVDSVGKVVAVSRGNAVITATVSSDGSDVSDLSDVLVDIVSLTGLVVSPPSVSLVSVGQTQPLTVTGQYNNGTTQPLPAGNSFVSGNPGVATVSLGGVVEAVADGLTQVMVYRSGVPPVAVPVQVNTGADPAPTVQILSPPNGSAGEPGATVAVSVRARDATAGVTRVQLSATGAAVFSAMRQISPPAADTTQIFNFQVYPTATVGSVVQVAAWAADTSGHGSETSRIALVVGDSSAPAVSIVQPPPGSAYGYGDTVPVHVQVADATGVTQVWFHTTGALTLSEARRLSPPAQGSNVVFSFAIPFGVPYPDVTIHAQAWDTLGNQGVAIPVPITISDADITPPATIITAVSNPGAGTTATVSYEVTDGLSDLDHVEIYFRRDGFGTFNRYTDADGGNPLGHYVPQSGTNGTMVFNSLKMGGDGTYEFYSIGEDQYGNRELAPTSGPDQVRSFSAGTSWVTISSNTNIHIGNTTYDHVNLRIQAATVTVEGVHSFLNLELLNGARMTHPQTTSTTEYGLEFSAWTVTLDSNSTINVDARGYPGGNREGNSASYGLTLGLAPGSTYRSGGSYGGSGGALEGTPASLYGNLTAPAELGSGGSYGAGGVSGGDGGGRLRVNAVNIVIDGEVSADGGNGQGNDAGSGSGGGIYFVVSTISGRGTVTANGGGYQIGGGGGRIAVHYADIRTYDTGLLEALGGDGSGSRDGGNGTVFLRSLEEAGGTLVVDGQGAASSFSTLPIPPGWVFDNIILRNSARVIADDPLVVSNALSIQTGSILTHSLSQSGGLVVTARVVEVDASSSINVSGKGYRGGNNSGNPNSYGYTLNDQPGSTYRSGGSYGGLGGAVEGTAGPAYGHPGQPVYLGSGGSYGAGGVAGGNGGGRVTIAASQALVVDGAILADGSNGQGNDAGSGSGGSILIDTSLLRGTGVIRANGGGNQVGGGGGRIAIAYDYFGSAGDDLNATRNIVARGGRGSYDGSAGTILLRRHDQAYGDLYIDDENTIATASAWTPLTHIGFGRSAWITADTLVTDGKVRLVPGGLAGLELNPNVAQAETFTIIGNNATSITVDVSGGIQLTDVAATGDEYAAVYRFDNVYFRRGGYLVLGDKVVVDGTLLVDEFGKITHYDATASFDSRIDLTAGTIDIASNGTVSADARGYPGGNRHGNPGPTGQTLDHAAGSTYRSGGSYGGIGGRVEGTPNATYGSLTQPSDLGSGGSYGAGGVAGGDGGGWISLVAGTLRVDGVLSANGGNGQGNDAGSGSGGTISLDVSRLEGSGVIQANGGSYQVAGGGGRIAIRYNVLTFPPDHFECFGGQASYDGGNGTLFLKQTAQAFGDLVVDGGGVVTPSDSTPIPGGYVFDNITLRNQARVVADSGLSVSNTLSVETSSILTHTLRQEAGLAIATRRLEVGPTAAIDASSKGYRGGNGGGWPHEEGETVGGLRGSTYRSGGSYGGLGGGIEGIRNQTYGDALNPVHLGSGGSYGAGGVAGGAGGGRITITASEYVDVDGAIRANGRSGSGNDAGSGSGGAIKIEAGELRGAGVIEASGGAYQVPGGGGRIAITYASLGGGGDDLDGLRSIKAPGGLHPSRSGSAGTVILKQSGQGFGDLYIDSTDTNVTASAWTPLTHIGFGRSQTLIANELTTDGRVSILPNALIGLRLNPNLGQDTLFTIVANTASTILVDVSGGTNLTDVASAGDEYAAVYRFDNLVFRRGGFLVMGDRLVVNGKVHLDDFGSLTHYDATDVFDSRLELFAGAVIVGTNGSVNVNARGFPGGNREGNGNSFGLTTNHAAGSTYRSGGSYGGLGYSLGGVPNPVYGSAALPADLGSGGSYGAGGVAGGDGGGRLAIHAATVTVHGAITADGGNGQGNDAGSGSGGSILIETHRITGDGAIRARGGAYQVPGGGGRVAIYFDTATSDTNLLAVSCPGGVVGGRTAGDGSVHFDGTYTYVPFSLRGDGHDGGSVSGSKLLIVQLNASAEFTGLAWVEEGPKTFTDYVVEFSPVLVGSQWVPLEGSMDGSEWVGTIPVGVQNGFIRIRRVAP